MTMTRNQLRPDRLTILHWVTQAGPEEPWHLCFGGEMALCGAQLPARRLVYALRNGPPSSPGRCAGCIAEIRTRLDI